MFEGYWDNMFEPYAGKTYYYQTMIGNTGDQLIDLASYELMKRYAMTPVPFADAQVVFCAGGGNLGSLYPSNEQLRNKTVAAALAADKPVIILPQSFVGETTLDLDVKLYAREAASYAALAERAYDVYLVPDIALSFNTDIKWDGGCNEGVFMRCDSESKLGLKRGNDPAKLRHPLDYLRTAARYRKIVSDRLHFVIASVLVGVPDITIVANTYHKNKAMWESWLKELGVRYED